VTGALLTLSGFTLDLPVGVERRRLIHGIDLEVGRSEAVALVGESGSGKSLTARSVIRLLSPGAAIGGDILFDGRSVLAMSASQLRTYRSNEVAMIFQDPRAHINPIRTVGSFLVDGLVKTRRVSKQQATERGASLLQAVGIGDAYRRMNQHPHELSGGLLQRVMIAAALMIEPRLLLADEPTTALDVTTQEEVMAILDELRRDRGLSMLFITHDLDLAAAVTDRVAVMRAGRLVETLASDRLYDEAADPYTIELLEARVAFDHEEGTR
jgi:ABC-type dipeptide/oligopeptide/nickel transport system ATPase component